MSNSARDAILGRVRQALKRPSQDPHWLHEPIGAGPLFDLPEPNETALAARFQKELGELLGEWVEFGDLASARDAWKVWRNDQPGRVLAPEHPRLRPLLEQDASVQWVPKDNQGREGWEDAAIGVTPALALIAESGSVVVAADISGRLLSLLPPTHVVVATKDQLVPDIDTAFSIIRKRYGGNLPSTLSLISGPSRTADIEKILVLGAHGPKKLRILMLPAGSLPAV